MISFISCAKTMASRTGIATPPPSQPRYLKEARENALAMGQYSTDELEQLLRVNRSIATDNRLRYQEFHNPDGTAMPALCAYTGAVFKRIAPADFTTEDFNFAQQHLFITSFLYGLLRPLDAIRPYRMEGDIRLPEHGGCTMFDFWKPLLTDYLLEQVRQSGGTLVNLASAEMKDLFHWKRIENEARVITPEFQVWKNGRLKTVVIYAKMCRGEMTRYLIKNRIDDPQGLKDFCWEGFKLDESRSTDNHWLFTMES